MEKCVHLDHIALGVCYYPEQWPRTMWQSDLRRMKAHGIETVRVFEFAWSVIEPKDDTWDFSLFDEFLSLAAEEKMQVIMGTPSATPPAWLTHAHPEVLNSRQDGTLYRHGHRRHYNYNSPVYHAYVRRVVTKLAERYGDHPAIIGWQIDNELNCETNVFYSEADHKAFRAWLKKRFGTVEALNDAIGGRFWSESFSDWEEVFLERPVIALGNPHLSLLEKEFISDSAIAFAQMQVDILRQYIGNRFITTNGMFGHLRNDELTNRVLDFYSYDNYPNFAYGQSGINGGDGGDMKDRASSYALSTVRGFSPNFAIMEQQSGAHGWDHVMLSPMPLPGQMRLWTMQAIAHGADYVSYFRWRTASYGTEMYWHGILDYDSRDNRRLKELGEIHQDTKRLNGLTGSRYQARVLLMTDWLNEWDGERDKWYGPMSYQSSRAIFAAAQHTHTPLDIKPWSEQMTADDLADYQLIFLPHVAILPEKMAEVLTAYCRAGGKLVMGARTGYKDQYGRCVTMPMPGYAAALCGVTVEEYSLPRPEEQAALLWDGASYAATGFQETLKANDSQVLARYDSGWLKGEAALCEKGYPQGGCAWYAGTGFTEALAGAFLERAGVAHPYAEMIDCPECVELAVRSTKDTEWFFLLNYTQQAQQVHVSPLLTEVIGNGENLPPLGVSVWVRKK